MPAVSGPQYRAMQAAAHGHSTLGISKKVGKEYVDATPASKRKAFARDVGTQLAHRKKC